jgi:predicted amidohydrolase
MDTGTVVPWAEGTRDFLADLAHREGIWVLGGYAEAGDPKPHNACSLFDPGGDERLHYRKIHPFSLANEPEHYRGGDQVLTAEVEGVRLTPLICYDLRFPEPFRAAADRTDLFAVIANWPEKRSNAWRILLAARAVENQCFVLGVNRVGVGSGQPHRGDSALLDPFGHVRASASRDPAVVLGPVTAREVEKARRMFSFLRDRRPEVYARLGESGSRVSSGGTGKGV